MMVVRPQRIGECCLVTPPRPLLRVLLLLLPLAALPLSCCAVDDPAVVVLAEADNDFAEYYHGSDAGVVAFVERSTGTVSLASCELQDAASCGARSDWSVTSIATYHDQSILDIDVARLADGRVLVVFSVGYPAAVKGLLCADVACASPAQLDIDADRSGAGDGVRVAASDHMVAIAYATGFQDGTGIKLATVLLSMLGVEPFSVQLVHGGPVCGTLAVAISGAGNVDRARVSFMGNKCQNVSYVACSDMACTDSATTLVAGKLQHYDPSSYTIYAPAMAVRSVEEALVAFQSQGPGNPSGDTGELYIATIKGEQPVVVATSLANMTKLCAIDLLQPGGTGILAYEAGQVDGSSSLVVRTCSDSSCTALDDPMTVEDRVQINELHLHAIGVKDDDAALMLSYTSYCREENDADAAHACIKVALQKTSRT